MPGPPPKPTALKLLAGNPGKRKLPVGEVKPALGADVPAWAKAAPALVAEWKRQAPRLLRLGLLTEVDDDALMAMCVLNLAFQDAVRNEAGPSKLAFISKELRALWSRFGMTPADRARVTVKTPEKKDPVSSWLANG